MFYSYLSIFSVILDKLQLFSSDFVFSLSSYRVGNVPIERFLVLFQPKTGILSQISNWKGIWSMFHSYWLNPSVIFDQLQLFSLALILRLASFLPHWGLKMSQSDGFWPFFNQKLAFSTKLQTGMELHQCFTAIDRSWVLY